MIERIKILAFRNLGDQHHSSVSLNNNSLIPWTSDMGEPSMAAFNARCWLFLPSDTNGQFSFPQMQALRSLDQNSRQLSWFSDLWNLPDLDLQTSCLLIHPVDPGACHGP